MLSLEFLLYFNLDTYHKMPLFQNTVVSKYLKFQDQTKIDAQWELFKAYFHNSEIQENIRNSKEEQFQEGFLRELFVKVLGYTLNPQPEFNLTTEYKNVKDSKKADGAILVNNDVRAVIELKGTNTTDLSKVEAQAFGYKNNQLKCTYVITSNFEKIRFYIDNAIEHLELNLFTLSREEFELLYLCLAFENIKKDLPSKIKKESLSEEDVITKKLYKDYSKFKNELYHNLVELNPQYDRLLLFKQSQTLLDRFLFLFFAEDRHLLPPNSVRLILTQWKKLKDLDAYTPLFDRFKKYFGYLNTGYKGKNYDVFPYNGGLFKANEVLDNVLIDDDLLYKHTLEISEYDFNSEVDVNILGHIFENSLNELDEVKAKLEGKEVDKTISKRKKDGVFYTPKYITKYIVENTVGKLCEEKKSELEISEDEYVTDKKRQKKTVKGLLDKLTAYREWLLQVTICDPACGSGAFLNQALDFLILEHSYIDELQAKLFGDAMILSDVEKSILEHNLFGVDLNEESVEIAKLSLWLRTAQPNRKLNDLSDNIKCGNSLIDDPEVAGDKAFSWEKEFPHIFEKGGFDVVIGNPPYGAELQEDHKIFLENIYDTYEYQVNTYVLFYEKGFLILKTNGMLGFITPATFTYQHYFSRLRDYIQRYKQTAISKYFYEVFEDADIGDSVTWITQKVVNNEADILVQICINKEDSLGFGELKKYTDIINSNDKTYILSALGLNLSKLEIETEPLGKITNIIVGIKPYQTGKGKPKQTKEDVKSKNFTNTSKIDDSYINCIIGKDFHRYRFIQDPEMYLKYGEWLAEPRGAAPFFDDEKIILRQTSDSLICTIDSEKRVNLNNVYNIGKINDNYNLKYIVTLLNSKLLNLFYQNISQEKGRTFAEVKKVYLAKLPIKKSTISSQKAFVGKADQILSLNQVLKDHSQKFHRALQREFVEIDKLSKNLENWYELTYADFLKELKKKKVDLSLGQKAEWEDYFLAEQEKALDLKVQIEHTDKEIDQMVYDLYDLSEEEIEIVENSSISIASTFNSNING